MFITRGLHPTMADNGSPILAMQDKATHAGPLLSTAHDPGADEALHGQKGTSQKRVAERSGRSECLV